NTAPSIRVREELTDVRVGFGEDHLDRAEELSVTLAFGDNPPLSHARHGPVDPIIRELCRLEEPSKRWAVRVPRLPERPDAQLSWRRHGPCGPQSGGVRSGGPRVLSCARVA